MADQGRMMPLLTDGVVRLRPPVGADIPILIAGRDDAFFRFIGRGSATPQPTFVIKANASNTVVGWIDYERDAEQTWLAANEVNVGYNVFAAYRGQGIAARSLRLLLQHLATVPSADIATLTIHDDNVASLRVAARAGFAEHQSHRSGSRYFKRAIATG